MGYLGATLTQVFTRAGGVDVLLRDVTITQMGSGARECRWRHTPEACRGFWGFWKKSVSWVLPQEKTVGFRLLAEARPVALGQVPHVLGVGGRWKSHHRKIVHLSSLCWNLSLKGNKRFCTWTKKSLCVFRVSGFLCSMYICYEYSMYISNIRIWLCNIITFTFGLIPLNKSINPFIPLSYGLNSTITVLLQRWIWH